MKQKDYRIPEGERVYAIGDIHGHLTQLEEMHDLIHADITKNPISAPKIVYLGDSIDRGPDSKGVLDCLIARELIASTIQHIFLLGNHEQRMLSFIQNPAQAKKDWLVWGGIETLISYGITPQIDQPLTTLAPLVAAELDAVIPSSHREFLKNLTRYHVVGDYLFVHAGIRPKVPLNKQRTHDLVFIREGFLDNNFPHEKRVVHGHTITKSKEIDIQPHRINVDTGLYEGGALSCVVLEGNTVQELQVR